MTNEQADKAFQALHDAQRQAHLLFMDLRDAGNSAGAKDAKLRMDRLQTEIDSLINTELNAWKAGAERQIPQLTELADSAQKAIDGVKRDMANAQKVVQAMKALDKVITAAMKFLG